MFVLPYEQVSRIVDGLGDGMTLDAVLAHVSSALQELGARG